MKLTTLIIEHDVHWLATIIHMVQASPFLELTATCSSALEGHALLAEHAVDLIICDIDIPGGSGLNFIRNLQDPPMVIFVSAHREQALDCFDVSPVDFLLKPISPDRFIRAVEKARHRFDLLRQADIEPYFLIRENQNYVQIAYENVLFMKAQENFLHIVTINQSYMPLLSISKVEESLKGNTFLRVHRSYLVNRSAIVQIGKTELILSSGHTIPIGEQYRATLNRRHIQKGLITRTN
ncbi:DNA-binding response regulator [Arsenicibacter rosenii]|uniref:DNA-binding response regulator n=2 Tax=Arsenicibacter rosenii TaxID=1750698 RepID=A0A1S2VNN6_9BACT|nr:DNA-binding response regulator [Arsenicibacter rosenii]